MSYPYGCDPDRPVTPAQIAAYCPGCDPDFPDIHGHKRSCPHYQPAETRDR